LETLKLLEVDPNIQLDQPSIKSWSKHENKKFGNYFGYKEIPK